MYRVRQRAVLIVQITPLRHRSRAALVPAREKILLNHNVSIDTQDREHYLCIRILIIKVIAKGEIFEN
jgi:hypothetical protein